MGEIRFDIFDKVYSCYYRVVQKILEEAKSHPITRKDMETIAAAYGYGESALTIVPKLLNREWDLLRTEDGKTFAPKTVPGRLPLTLLQRSWLKALLADRRISCFLTPEEQKEAAHSLRDVEPLFGQADFHYFDRCLDGDTYSLKTYQKHFRTVLEALEQGLVLRISYCGRQGAVSRFEAAPYQLQYSEKDDKFRLCCLKKTGGRFSLNTTLNMNKIAGCSLTSVKVPKKALALRFSPIQKSREPVLLEISKERNSLERCMLHFANYEKHTKYDEERDVYYCSIYYDLADETELLIDVLSFGPVIKVLGPACFLSQVKQRVRRQYEMLNSQTHTSRNLPE